VRSRCGIPIALAANRILELINPRLSSDLLENENGATCQWQTTVQLASSAIRQAGPAFEFGNDPVKPVVGIGRLVPETDDQLLEPLVQNARLISNALDNGVILVTP